MIGLGDFSSQRGREYGLLGFLDKVLPVLLVLELEVLRSSLSRRLRPVLLLCFLHHLFL